MARGNLERAKTLVARAREPEHYEDQAYPHAASRYDEARMIALIDIAETLRAICTTLENIENKLP